MKTTNRIALLMGAGAIGLFLNIGTVSAQAKPKGKPWDAPAAEASKKNPSNNADAIKEGKDIYSQNCKSCHGAKGLGDGDKSKTIEISCGDFTAASFNNESEGSMYWKITSGRKPMPSFKDKLSDSERWKVVAYIRSMAKK